MTQSVEPCVPDDTESLGEQEQRDTSTHQLLKTDIQDRLSVMGIHPFTSSIIYTTVDLCNLGILDLAGLQDFPNLQNVLCRHNHLTTLEPLRYLPLLLRIDSSHNSLRHVLDFVAPKCTTENAWSSGGKCIGSVLRYAKLNYNQIQSLPLDLSNTHPYLQELHLAHNEITCIDGIASLQYLRILDLSHNKLQTSSGLTIASSHDTSENGTNTSPLPALETLCLAFNHLENVENFKLLPRLTSLDLTSNHINSLEDLQECKCLRKLSLSSNEINDFNTLNPLMHLQLLQSLSLLDCPVIDREESLMLYRARVLRRLQQLSQLDGQTVSAKEKVKSLIMHGSDISIRRQQYLECLPGHEFVNSLPALDFEEDGNLPPLPNVSTL